MTNSPWNTALTKFHTLDAASNSIGRLKDSYIRETAFQERFCCGQACKPSTNNYYSRLSFSP